MDFYMKLPRNKKEFALFNERRSFGSAFSIDILRKP